jgi:hypothetical protein
MPQALPFIMAGLSVAQGIQGMQQNNAMAKAVGQQADANIQNEKNTALIKKQQLTRAQELSTGRATVSAAGSGATLNSFDSLFNDNSQNQLMDNLMLDYDSKMSQENIRYNAAVQKSQFKSAAKSSLIGGIVNAGVGLAGSGAFGSAGGTSPSGATFGNKAFNSSYFNTTTASGLSSHGKATTGL